MYWGSIINFLPKFCLKIKILTHPIHVNLGQPNVSYNSLILMVKFNNLNSLSYFEIDMSMMFHTQKAHMSHHVLPETCIMLTAELGLWEIVVLSTVEILLL